MAKDNFNLHEWVGNKERRLLKEDYNSYNEGQKEDDDRDEDLIAQLTPVPQVIDEEFSEFKGYDDIIGGLIIRAEAMKKYLNQNEPDLEYLADDLKETLEILDKEIDERNK